MPKIVEELAPVTVGKLTAPGHHPVGGIPGLYLYVQDTGARSWVLRVMVGSKRRHIGLGSFPAVTLAQARTKAREAREAIAKGQDPIAERAQARAALKAAQATAKTFEQCARTYVDEMKGEWSNPKHQAQWLATLETYAFPIIGSLDVSAIGLPHVLEVLKQPQTKGKTSGTFWEVKTETASRFRGRLESILDWATVHQYRDGLNPARWKGHLDALLKDPNKIKKVKHHEALPIDDMGKFMQALRTQDGTGARALEFTILTATRSGETRGAKWSEIDMEAGVWVVPAERMKANKEHRVPLSSQALALLKSITPDADNDLVFPAPRGGVLSDMTLTAVLRRMEAPAVPHGFRSTFRDWAADRTNFPRDLCEFALAHTLDSKTEAAYLRTDMLEKRRKLMQSWADHCDKTETATVIQFEPSKITA